MITQNQHSRIRSVFMYTQNVNRCIHFPSVAIFWTYTLNHLLVYKLTHLWESLWSRRFVYATDWCHANRMFTFDVCSPFPSIRPYTCCCCCFCIPPSTMLIILVNYLFIYTELSVVLNFRNEIFARVHFLYLYERGMFHVCNVLPHGFLFIWLLLLHLSATKTKYYSKIIIIIGKT